MGAGSLKRKRVKQPEEVTFDFEARQEYLTGFHKRKLQRAKHAKEAAARKEREEKAKTRKLVGEHGAPRSNSTNPTLSYVTRGRKRLKSM